MSIKLSYNFTRLLFSAFNILFLILGCGCLGVGIWLYVSKSEYLALSPAAYGALSAAGLCVAAGGLVIVISIVGCCGAWIENRCLLITYFVIVLLVFVIETTAGALGFLYRDEVEQVVYIELMNHIKSSYIAHHSTDPRSLRVTFDRLQTRFECCGIDGYQDWYNTARWPDHEWVPDSCCNPLVLQQSNIPFKNCGRLGNQTDLWFQTGCYRPFSRWLLEHLEIAGILGIVMAVLQVFGMIASVFLYCGIRDREFAFNRH